MSDGADTKNETLVPATKDGAPAEPAWGRVIIAGGTDWPNLGKRDKGGQSLVDQENYPDLYEPHVLRPLCNVKIRSVHGSGCASHFVAIDVLGAAWLWGRNNSSCLGLDDEKINAVHLDAPIRITPSLLGAPQDTQFVHAACGRHHTLLVGSDSQVWVAGLNTLGQCGHPPADMPHLKTFTLLESGPKNGGEKERVVQAAAGVSFSLLLTDNGRVYAFGSAEHGQLGNGNTGEHIGSNRKAVFDIIDEPTVVEGLEGKEVTQIAAGNQHSLALTKDGLVYVWGAGGYCRTGLGKQEDALTAQLVPAPFTGEHEDNRAWKVVAGPTSSMVIDRQRITFIAGKWKQTGDGSAGQAYTVFKRVPDLEACKVSDAVSGGVAHFAVAPDDEDDARAGLNMAIAWGQNAQHGELALGNEAPLSATRPTRIEPLRGVHVFALAAGQHSIVLLSAPSSELSSLPRHPHVDAPSECIVCSQDRGEEDSPLECEKCETPYHLGCLDPPLSAVPDDEWFCKNCTTAAQSLEAGKKADPSESTTQPATNGTAPVTTVNGDADHATVVDKVEPSGLKRKAPDEDTPVENGDAKKSKPNDNEA